MRTLVVVPTYDEAGNVGPLLRQLRAAVPDADVLVVDDASPDGTAAVVESLADELGHIEVLHRPGKSGLGRAYREGFARGLTGDYEVIVQMDADLSHDPAALPSLLAPIFAGEAEMVIGSRYVPGGAIPAWPWHRRALSRFGNRYATTVLGIEGRDITSGYRAYVASTLAGLDLDSVRADGYGFMIELARRAAARDVRIVEVPITFADRIRGESKMSGRIIAEALLLVTAWGARDRLRTLRDRFRTLRSGRR